MNVPLIGAASQQEAEKEKFKGLMAEAQKTYQRIFPSAPSPMVAQAPWWQGKTLHDDIAMAVLTTLLANDGSIKAALADGKAPNDDRLDNYCRFSYEMSSRAMVAREQYFAFLNQAWALQDVGAKEPKVEVP